MDKILPFQPSVSEEKDGPRVFSLTGERADEVFSALSSSTARHIIELLYAEPRPASELTDHTETSLQNVRYHLDRMRDANLVTVAGTWYSEKGNEMRVYAPTDTAIVLCASEPTVTDRLREAMPRLIGMVAVVAGASAVVQHLFERFVESDAPSPMGVEAVGVASKTGPSAPQQPAFHEYLSLLTEPGMLFFLGSILGLAVMLAYVYRRNHVVG